MGIFRFGDAARDEGVSGFERVSYRIVFREREQRTIAAQARYQAFSSCRSLEGLDGFTQVLDLDTRLSGGYHRQCLAPE